jgi:hypothetical protein
MDEHALLRADRFLRGLSPSWMAAISTLTRTLLVLEDVGRVLATGVVVSETWDLRKEKIQLDRFGEEPSWISWLFRVRPEQAMEVKGPERS